MSSSDSIHYHPKIAPILVISIVMLLMLASASVAVWIVSGTSASRSETSTGTQPPQLLGVGALAPDFELTNVDTGQPVTLSSLRGKPVWLNFWATWCPPCKTELPFMKQLYDKYGSQNLVIVGIDMQENPSAVRSFVQSNGYAWTFVVDTDGAVTNRYFMAGIPTHVFVDRNGVIQAIRVGDLQEGDMAELLGKIIDGTSLR
jgi:cytochrome c biogenesis protein CcmG/thiol:disulfide interchange protein DsbE